MLIVAGSAAEQPAGDFDDIDGPRGAFAEEMIEDREEVTLGLARAGACGHYQIPAGHRLLNGLLLMSIERSLGRECIGLDFQKSLVQEPTVDQIPDRGTLFERR